MRVRQRLKGRLNIEYRFQEKGTIKLMKQQFRITIILFQINKKSILKKKLTKDSHHNFQLQISKESLKPPSIQYGFRKSHRESKEIRFLFLL